MAQKELIHKSGDQAYQCMSSAECEGASYCDFDTTYNIGKCICSMWTAREYHAATIHQNYIYLSGGYTFPQLSNCGSEQKIRQGGTEYACGGGYRVRMNDVWRSKDGQAWEMMTGSAPWDVRGEHAMVSFNGFLWILGGRSENEHSETRVLNDIWRSRDGAEWTLVTEHADWGPRAQHTVVVLVDEADDVEKMFLDHGENDEVFLDDVWSWDGKASKWLKDFGPESAAKNYIDSSFPVSLGLMYLVLIARLISGRV